MYEADPAGSLLSQRGDICQAQVCIPYAYMRVPQLVENEIIYVSFRLYLPWPLQPSHLLCAWE